ncbi:AlaDh_PNT_C domain-containing protein [Pseudoscourfieldia marina]
MNTTTKGSMATRAGSRRAVHVRAQAPQQQHKDSQKKDVVSGSYPPAGTPPPRPLPLKKGERIMTAPVIKKTIEKEVGGQNNTVMIRESGISAAAATKTKRAEEEMTALAQMLNPSPSDRVLVLGLGTLGTRVAQDVLRMGASVVAIDTDQNAVNDAKSQGINARFVDAQNLTKKEEYHGQFDSAVATGTMSPWLRSRSVLQGVHSVMRDGSHGKFVGELRGHGDSAALRVALTAAIEEIVGSKLEMPARFLPTATDMSKQLRNQFFHVEMCKLIPDVQQASVGDLRNLYLMPMTTHIEDGELRHKVIQRAVALCEGVLCDSSGTSWHVGTTTVRFMATSRYLME